MGVTRTLSELGPLGLVFLGVSLLILLFSAGCYLASFARRWHDARVVDERSARPPAVFPSREPSPG
ncbi:hypothetical protein AB0E21_01525 [Streptomyces sp. NPDC047967]|uniref:hypothetical protein n=1 Tax=unclassified Streptomyces TaxID=2593676 RepID=UPI0033FF9564